MKLNPKQFNAVIERIEKDLLCDPHHRLLSWDHAWEHWKSFVLNPHGDESYAALHLAFYLASWGMYRGSSHILYRDFKVFVPVVRFLKAQVTDTFRWEDSIFDETLNPDKLAHLLGDMANALGNIMKPKLCRPGKVQVKITDTLLSKILLNTLSCVPAFDTEVNKALRNILNSNYPSGDGLDHKRLVRTIELARVNKSLLQNGQSQLTKSLNKQYPLTKVLDLYLWHHGNGLPKSKKAKTMPLSTTNPEPNSHYFIPA